MVFKLEVLEMKIKFLLVFIVFILLIGCQATVGFEKVVNINVKQISDYVYISNFSDDKSPQQLTDKNKIEQLMKFFNDCSYSEIKKEVSDEWDFVINLYLNNSDKSISFELKDNKLTMINEDKAYRVHNYSVDNLKKILSNE